MSVRITDVDSLEQEILVSLEKMKHKHCHLMHHIRELESRIQYGYAKLDEIDEHRKIKVYIEPCDEETVYVEEDEVYIEPLEEEVEDAIENAEEEIENVIEDVEEGIEEDIEKAEDEILDAYSAWKGKSW